jgi:hypothetical protein
LTDDIVSMLARAASGKSRAAADALIAMHPRAWDALTRDPERINALA